VAHIVHFGGVPNLRPPYGELLKFKGSKLKLLKSILLKLLYANCLGLFPAILAQFTLEMGAAAYNRKTITQTLFKVVQGR